MPRISGRRDRLWRPRHGVSAILWPPHLTVRRRLCPESWLTVVPRDASPTAVSLFRPATCLRPPFVPFEIHCAGPRHAPGGTGFSTGSAPTPTHSRGTGGAYSTRPERKEFHLHLRG